MVIFLKFWVVFIVSSFVSNPVAYIFNINRLLLRYYFRKCGSVQKDTVVVSVENFLYEASENLWLDFSCLVLSDPLRKIQLQSYSQPTNVTPEQIQILKDSTPSDYPKQWSGFAVPIDVVCTERLRKHKFDQLQGGVMAKELQVSPELWQEAVSGISRRRLLTLAGEGLAGMYKREIKLKVEVI
ncbi:protein PRRC1 isoform X1 [Eurytemora carolleeae]|uniref:protein PRRC1 isoform X1 n=1 Tax=Eurytemora carolleeae TaxID=1294199 RepID=UPI000C77FEF9|nr:protein PRRC1 isoform X1 [Eurytemora carolleeae]|eukprot:XP_023328121.1 protein PRRC1-like isoform X1 [Eurytemora affinis]